MWYDCTSLDGERSSFSTLRPGGKNKESSYLPEGDLRQTKINLLGTQLTCKSHRAFFKRLPKNQYQNYNSGQSQKKKTARWTNLRSYRNYTYLFKAREKYDDWGPLRNQSYFFFAFHNNSSNGCSHVSTELSWIAAVVNSNSGVKNCYLSVVLHAGFGRVFH